MCACSLKNWREALALLLTYSGPEKFPELCGRCGPSFGMEHCGFNMELMDISKEEAKRQPELWEARLCC